MKTILFSLIALASLFSGCRTSAKEELIVFHAGSLAVPLNLLADEYEEANPGTTILLEAAGSLVCARKITELAKPCDIMASADYQIIDEMLIPEFAGWNLGFATNEIVIAYTERSKSSESINSNNWTEILRRDDVIYGRSDPDADPCGYRTLLTLKLAEEYYNIPGLQETFSNKDKTFIRPKETDLIALLETGAVDYIFQYKSVAVQHSLKYLELPDEINLGNTSFGSEYKSVSLPVTGSKPGETLIINGDYIMYGITLLDKAPNKEAASGFLAFIISPRGREVFSQSGQNVISPPVISGNGAIPEIIRNSIKQQ